MRIEGLVSANATAFPVTPIVHAGVPAKVVREYVAGDGWSPPLPPLVR